ncbi:hypothetical protein BJ170DRAFT_297897 [Xylariales sp. AK1849]|nr:hypothetical protein BJ170DRAFT_297897 [Xylariales sp. AK1849]
MRLLFLPIVAVFSVLGAAESQAVGSWNVSDIRRDVSDDKINCNWGLTITQSEAPGAELSCDFTVSDLKGQACDLIQFSEPCNGGGSDFVVNGGHSPMNFTVLVLYNAIEDAKAYFGASDEALNSHRTILSQYKPAYPVSNDKKRGLVLQEKDDISSGGEETSSWMVQSLTRVVKPDAPSVMLDFLIQETPTSVVPCHITVSAARGTDLTTMSWSYQRCIGSEYSVSWGYMPAEDAGIMTLVSPAKDQNCFFGFNNVSTNQYLGSAGPNPVILL